MGYVGRFLFAVLAAGMLSINVACEKEEKDFREEIVGTYSGTMKMDLVIVEPATLPDDVPSNQTIDDAITIEVSKDPSDSKGIILKEKGFSFTMLNGEDASNGSLFNLKDHAGKIQYKDGDVINYKALKSYVMEVNGKDTDKFHAKYDKSAKTIEFIFEVDYATKVRDMNVKMVGTINFNVTKK